MFYVSNFASAFSETIKLKVFWDATEHQRSRAILKIFSESKVLSPICFFLHKFDKYGKSVDVVGLATYHYFAHIIMYEMFLYVFRNV